MAFHFSLKAPLCRLRDVISRVCLKRKCWNGRKNGQEKRAFDIYAGGPFAKEAHEECLFNENTGELAIDASLVKGIIHLPPNSY